MSSLLLLLSLFQPPTIQEPAPERLAWGDFDRDGRLDVVALDHGALRLLHNDADGSLSDWTARAGLLGVVGGIDATLVDVDADGLLDLLVVVPGDHSRLFLQSEGVFADAGSGSGLDLRPGLVRQRWIDWNADGLPDVSLRARGGERFYENLGGATFRELVSAEFLAPGPARTGSALRPDASPPPDAGTALPGAPALGGFGGASGAGNSLPAAVSPYCAAAIVDEATGACIKASSDPVAGMLYPLGPELMIDSAGYVGIGTVTPAARLDVAGAARADSLTLTESVGPPLAVASSTKVAGLNVDLLDGIDSSVFSQLGATIDGAEIEDGTLTDDDIGPGANIAGSKIVPDFGASDVTTDARVVVNGGAGATAQVSVRATALDGLISATTSTSGYGLGGIATATSGVTQGVYGETLSTSGNGVRGLALAGSGVTSGVFGQSQSVDGRGVVGVAIAPSGDGVGVYGLTNSPTGSGIHGYAPASTGSAIGVLGETFAPSGIGVGGAARSASGTTVGVYGDVNSDEGTGVVGRAANGTGPANGVRGETSSTGGTGVYGIAFQNSGSTRGVYGVSNSPTGDGVVGRAKATTGAPSGVEGQSDAEFGIGVRGYAADIVGVNVGVQGETNSVLGTGVAGLSSLAFAGSLTASRGVKGQVVSGGGTGVWGAGSTGGLSDGVRGTTPHSGGYGVYGLGQNGADGVVGGAVGGGDAVRAAGDFSASGTKSFAQPHPIDAAREIRFVCLEGNESGTYFRGSAELIAGAAVIEVPEAFRLVTAAEGLTVQLTAVGGPARLWVESRDLERIVVRGDIDAPFDYFVNGVRRGFTDFEPIQANRSFRPRMIGEPWGAFLPETLREDLVRSGVLNPDFSPNLATAEALGWELAERLEQPAADAGERNPR